MKKSEPLIFEYKTDDIQEYSISTDDVKEYNIPEKLLGQSDIDIPGYPERDLVKHYTNLSNENFGVDSGFYPLGSCTMKYNPKVSERLIANSKLRDIHPCQNSESIQGLYQLLYHLSECLQEITGMDYCSLEPVAGAQGELTGMLTIRNYLESNNIEKDTILIPDSAHGTNPASAVMAGFKVKEISSDTEGFVNPDILKEYIDENTAGIMLTNPNTLGLFEKYIVEVAEMIHKAGGLLYYDGANLNANMGYTNPGIMGFDIVHINIHKTFGTPHGSGGPGAGPVLVKEYLKKYLPGYSIVQKDGRYYRQNLSGDSVHAFNGNTDVLIKGLIYILLNGSDGLKKVTEIAVLNANYLKSHLSEYYNLPYKGLSKHEFVINDMIQHDKGITSSNIAKRLIDFNIHPPTIYFPLIVKAAMMIEPTETESKQVLDNFIDVMKKIADETESNPEIVKSAPNETIISKPDETLAARKPVLTYWE